MPLPGFGALIPGIHAIVDSLHYFGFQI